MRAAACSPYHRRMAGTGPDPHRVLDNLRAILADMKSIAAQFPDERALPIAADHVEVAIQVLAPVLALSKE